MTAPIWVEFTPFGSTHAHQLLIADGDLTLNQVLADIEEYADELAEGVRRCSKDRHKGHGQAHPPDAPELAFHTAIRQLFTFDYEKEWQEMLQRERAYKKWGGPVPAAVILPSYDNPKDWEMLVTDAEGNPYMYPVKRNVLDIPAPNQVGARPNREGIGWTAKRRWKAETKLRRLRDA